MSFITKIWRKITRKGKRDPQQRSNKNLHKSKSKRAPSRDVENDELFHSNDAAGASTEDDFAPNDFVDDLELGEEAYTLNLREEIKKMAIHQCSKPVNGPTFRQFDQCYHQPEAGYYGPQPFFNNQVAYPHGFVDPLTFSAMSALPVNMGMQPVVVSSKYFGLTDLEMLNFQTFIASRMSEIDVLQNNRVMSQAAAIPPLPGVTEEEHHRLECNRSECRMDANATYLSAGSANPSLTGVSRPTSTNLTKSVSRIVTSNMSYVDIKKANQDALQAGIALSIQESSRSPRSICHNPSPRAFQQSCSAISQNPIESRPARIVSFSRSKSGDSSRNCCQQDIPEPGLVSDFVVANRLNSAKYHPAPQYVYN